MKAKKATVCRSFRRKIVSLRGNSIFLLSFDKPQSKTTFGNKLNGGNK